MITKSASKCPAGIAYFCSLKTPQTATGLGRRKISAEDPRRRAGFMRLPAYSCRPSPGVLPGVDVCVRGCAIHRFAFKFEHVFFHPGLNKPVCPVKNTRIDHFLLSQKPPWSHKRVKEGEHRRPYDMSYIYAQLILRVIAPVQAAHFALFSKQYTYNSPLCCSPPGP